MPKSPLNRATALVAGSLIGMAGAVAFASPALAHHSAITYATSCDKVSGEWVVDWRVETWGSGAKDQKVEFAEVSLAPAGTTITGIQVGVPQDAGTPAIHTGQQRVPGSATQATLSVKAKWTIGEQRDGGRRGGWNGGSFQEQNPISATADLGGVCAPDQPSPSPSASSASPSPSASSASPSPSASSPAPSSPAPSSPAPSPSTSTTPPTSIPQDVPAEPIVEQTCDTITIGVDNTDNDGPFTIDYKTSKGEERTLVVKAGEKGTETFSATEGFTVDVTFTVEYQGKTYTESGTIPFEQGEDCTGGGGGGLPVTGAAAGGIAGGAAALLAIGGGLFFMARRRKVTFTA